jgi:hypothetical protein
MFSSRLVAWQDENLLPEPANPAFAAGCFQTF